MLYGIVILSMKFNPYKNKVCLDSRLIKSGEFFVPVKGENFNGYEYIDQSLKNGSAGVLELKELYLLSKEKLNKINPKIIGVTGSSGKTSMTSYLYTALSARFKCCRGRLNTKLGLSVNVINDMQKDCEIFIAEIGMDKAGEIADTVKMFSLDIAFITTINHVHIEKLGSLKNLIKAKAEILTGIKKDGVLLFNKDNEYVKKIATQFKGKKIGYGLSYASKQEIKSIISNTKLLGVHNISNLLGVKAACEILGFTARDIPKVFRDIKSPKGRLNLLNGINGSVMIDDSYNANPESTKYALDALVSYPGKKKIVILGDMLELGNFEQTDHQKILKYLSSLKYPISTILVGERFKLALSTANIDAKVFNTSRDVANAIQKKKIKISKNDIILVKGSQGIRMEIIVKALLKNSKLADKLLVRQDARWNSK